MFQVREVNSVEILCIVSKEGRLGAGGYGIVRAGFHRTYGRVAVKCFSFAGGKDEDELAIREIKNELDLLQQTNHENILRVYGWVQWESSMALVMELMPGGNLRRLLRDSTVELLPVLRLRFCEEISDGVSSIHNLSAAKRLTHGDLKPENILLTRDLRCKVGDFGSGKLTSYTGQTSTSSDPEQSPQITLVYAAPERLRKKFCRLRKEQDTYSYGLIVHGILSREMPHETCSSEREYLDAIKQGERPDMDAIDDFEASLSGSGQKEIVQVLKSVMIRCWQDKPTDRPDMLAVRDELQRLMAKQQPSDVMRGVAKALDKLSIFEPVESQHRCVPLNYFDTRTRTFRGDVSGHEAAHSTTGSSVAAATIAPTTSISPNDNQKEVQGVATISPSVATISPSVATITRSVATISPSVATIFPSLATISPSVATISPSVATISPSVATISPSVATISPATDTTSVLNQKKQENVSMKAEEVATISLVSGGAGAAQGEKNKKQTRGKQRPPSTQLATMSSVPTRAQKSKKSTKKNKSSEVAQVATMSSVIVGSPRASSRQASDSSTMAQLSTMSSVPTEMPQESFNAQSADGSIFSVSTDLATMASINDGQVPGNTTEATWYRKDLTLYEVLYSSDPSTLPPGKRAVMDLLAQYEAELMSGTASTVLNDLVSTIAREFNVTGDDMYALGEQLRYTSKLYLRSIAVFTAAFALFKKEMEAVKESRDAKMTAVDRFLTAKGADDEKVVQTLWTISRGLCHTAVAMVGHDPDRKRVVKQHVISLLNDVKDAMEDAASPDNSKCMLVAWVICFVGVCHGLIGEHDVEVKTHREAVARVKQTHDLDDVAWSMYATILQDLGESHSSVPQFSNAAALYRKLSQVYQSLSDVENQDVRGELIADCEEKLRMCTRP